MRIFIATICTLLLSLNVFAGVTPEELKAELAGRYSVTFAEGYHARFVIRSTGEVIHLSHGLEIGSITLDFLGSDEESLMPGLPIAHLTFIYGSDEETVDAHVFVALEKDILDEGPMLKIISVFETLNEGPNDYTSVVPRGSVRLEKYNKETKTYRPVVQSK